LKKTCFILTLLVIGINAYSQDAEFSQFLNNPVYLNPAMAGSATGPRFILNYRNQWPELQNAFITYAASYDQHINSASGGIGFQITDDAVANGIYNKLAITGEYNYLVKLNEKTALRAGFQASFLQTRIDWSKLLFGDQIDPATVLPLYSTTEQTPSFNKKSNIDIGAGLLIYSKKVYLGASFKHINQPDQSFYQDRKAPLPTRILINLGAEVKTKRNGKTYISPNVMFTSQGRFQEIVGYMMVIRGPVMLGLGLRNAFQNTDAMIFYAGIKTGIFKIMYSYDNTLSNLSGQTGGAHEISISLNLSEGDKANKKRNIKNSIQCPPLF